MFTPHGEWMENPKRGGRGSDRMALIDRAIRLVHTFRAPMGGCCEPGDAPRAEADLDANEKACYQAALCFLRHEFARGWVPKEPAPPEDERGEDPRRGKKVKV